MRAVVLGARGGLGRLVVARARDRGVGLGPPDLHSYDPPDALVAALAGSDALVMVFPASITEPHTYPEQLGLAMDAARAAGVSRVVGLVGSAGALTPHDMRLVDTDYFQETTRHFYLSVEDAWDVYRGERELDWVAFVPAARMQHHLADRGAYRTRTDEHLVTTDDDSWRYFDTSRISYGDCATAIVDELVAPRFSRQFVTVGW